eukprot:scaffold1233_cov111-Cylindrotheca_fusiformis.AAC.4
MRQFKHRRSIGPASEVDKKTGRLLSCQGLMHFICCTWLLALLANNQYLIQTGKFGNEKVYRTSHRLWGRNWIR